MANITKLLIEANKVRLGGYDTIDAEFIEDLLGYLYGRDSQGYKWLKAKYDKITYSWSGHPEVYISTLLRSIENKDSYLLNSQNTQVRNLYIKSLTDGNYAELVFLMFILGMVNGYDFLKYFRNIDYVVGRLSVNGKVPYGPIKRVSIGIRSYMKLMGMYLWNCSEGVDYGFSPYDFVYHMLNVQGLNSDKYSQAFRVIEKIGIRNYDCFKLDNSIVRKYCEEIGVMLPLLYGNIDIPEKVLLYILENVSPDLERVILTDSDFIAKAEGDCVMVR